MTEKICPRAFSQLVEIPLICEVVCALAWSDSGEGVGDCGDQGIDGSRSSLAEQSFDLGKELFDRVEIGAVGGQIAQLGASSFDRLSDSGDLVAGEIVDHDDVVLAQGRDDALLDVGAEAVTVHRPIEHTGCGDAIDPQGRDECRRLPMPPRNAGDEALATRAAAITARHVGRRTRFVDENQPFRVQVGLACAPLLTCRGDIRPILLGGAL